MYRIVGLGFGASGACAVPETCVQAVARYPSFINKSLVDEYCSWEKDGKGGVVEKLCLQALAEGEIAEQTVFEEGSYCSTDEDCASGRCDDGACALLYPYDKYSADTLAGQRAANAFRARSGLAPIPENGVLDKKTCVAWKEICDKQSSNPLEATDYIVAKENGQALPCFADGCNKAPTISAAAIGIGIGLLGIVGALVYYRS